MIETVLITGANRGLGLGHVIRFAANGKRVLAGVRDPKKATELQKVADTSDGRVTIFSYDAEDASSAEAAKRVAGSTPIDLLFANAGVYGGDKQNLGKIDAEEFARTLVVNTIAPLLLADALKDNVAKSKRKIIAFQSSQMGSNEGTSPGVYAYRSSKAALNKIASTMANELKAKGIIVVALHPGWAQTDMGGKSAPVTIPQSIEGQQKLLDSLTIEKTGGFYNYDGTKIAW